MTATAHYGARETATPAPGPLRVLLVSARYFPSAGGVQTHVFEVARRLAGAGADVTVLTTDPGGQLPAEERSAGVRVRRVRAWPARRDYYFAPGIYREIARGGWDVAHCQGCHTLVAPLAMLAARRARIPYIVTFHSGGHSSALRNRLRAAQWALLRPLLAGAARLVAVSRFEAALFQARLGLPPERFVVIPNGALAPAPEQPAAPGPPLIVSVGRLERYKGHQRVIAALPRLREAVPDVRLRVLGSGPYEAALRLQAQNLGVADRVEIGAIPPGDRQGMAAVLSSAALVTLLSDYEAHPIAVMEALALRRPVLVARTSGLRELADAGLARAVAPDSTPDEVAAAMLQQLRRPPALAGVALPTWERCAGDLLALYHDIARTRPCES